MGKKTKENKNTKTMPIPTITYEEYKNVLMLAEKIRIENKETLEQATTAKAKSQLVNVLFQRYNIRGHEATDPKEKELAVILKVNIFIPDTDTFIDDYKNKYNKNVRLIADSYQIPAPFVISKVAEIGKYESYLERLKQEKTDSKKPLEKKQNEMEIHHTEASSHSSNIPNTELQHLEEKKEETRTHHTEASSSPFDTSNIPNTELLHHIDSMQKYSTRLLDSNEQLARENEALKRYTREIEGMMKRLQQENEQLKGQVSHLTSENHSLREQFPNSNSSNTFAAENRLRQQVKGLEIANQELLERINILEQQNTSYKNRAASAEAQLEQWQSGIQGLYDQVENFDFSLEEDVNSPKTI